MRKFKLIKEYPGFYGELGGIAKAEEFDNFKYEWKHGRTDTFHLTYFTSYPEFWQEVKEPIFTTEDGVDTYYKDTYYYVITHDRGIIPHAWEVLGHIVDWENSKKVPLGRVQFHSLDKALTWIEKKTNQDSVRKILKKL